MNLDQYAGLAGQVVTVKLSSGLEIMSKLHGVDTGAIVLHKPMIVVISVDKVAIVPYHYTSDEEIVTISGEHVVSLCKSSVISTEDYIAMVSGKKDVS